MGLSFYLTKPNSQRACPCCGHHHTCTESEQIFSANITHNLIGMAGRAGLYECLWEPNENEYYKAEDIVPELVKSLNDLESYPEKFIPFNSSNGWGTYDDFVPFVASILEACYKHPTTTIEVCR